MSYGISAYGTSSYGCVPLTLEVANAFAVSTHTIRVTLTKEPQNKLELLAGDVLNPRTWQVTRLDTGVGFTVIGIEPHDDPLVWDVTVLEPLASVNVQHRIISTTLLDTGGSPIDPPRFFDFPGIIAAADFTNDRRLAQRQYNLRDYKNPMFPVGSDGAGGNLIIDSSGDYVLHEGPEFVRKLIYRRLMTVKGGFWHLPNYGVGLRVKEPLPTGDLITLQREISDQIRREPEVESTQVLVSQNQNSLIIRVQARLKATGQNLDFPIVMPFGGSE